MPNREPRNNLQEKGCVEQQGGVYEQHDQQEQRGVGETLDCIHCKVILYSADIARYEYRYYTR